MVPDRCSDGYISHTDCEKLLTAKSAKGGRKGRQEKLFYREEANGISEKKSI